MLKGVKDSTEDDYEMPGYGYGRQGYGKGGGRGRVSGGGPLRGSRKFRCLNCGYEFEVPFGQPKPMNCPRCGAPANMIVRIDRGRGKGWRRGQGGRGGFRGVSRIT